MNGQTWVAEDERTRTALAPEDLAYFRRELDTFREQLFRLEQLDPAEIMMQLSGIAGRIAEIRALLYRDNGPRATALRTREIDPLREDLEFHFKCHSRRLAVMEWELKLSGGAP